MNKVILILLFMCSIEVLSQPLTININGGMHMSVKPAEIRYCCDGGAFGGPSILAEIIVDYGKKKLIVEPFLGIGYKFAVIPTSNTNHSQYPVIGESGKYIDVGVKKTFEVGKVDLCLFGGLGYSWDSYLAEYKDIDFSQTFHFKGLKYQTGIQMNFGFFENIDVSLSYQFTVKEKVESKGTINRESYEFTGGRNSHSLLLGLSFNISEML